MKKIISVLTATRAEYGLLKPLIIKLREVQEFDVRIVATGAHLSPEFGLTYLEIEKDAISIDKKIEILLSSDTSSSISKSMGLAMISFADYFEDLKPDLLLVLGDRYETLAVAVVAMNQKIPIAHLYGGETTEGAIDESIRHAITKLSYIHFTSTDEYKDRVIQLGEHPSRVYNVGGLGVENIKNENLLTKQDLQDHLGISLSSPYAIVTYHPVTLDNQSSSKQILELLNVCKKHSELNFIFTKANADADGRIINKMLDEYALSCDNIFAFSSLGMINYLSALKYCEMVIGNSSSGLLEAPSFKIPSINIGDRQKGRIQSTSIINCEPTQKSISEAIKLAKDSDFRNKVKKTTNPYGDGDTTDKIINTLKEYIINKDINIKKTFFNVKGKI